MVDSTVEVENVSKRFGNTQSLDGLTFRVEAGEVFGLLGPNGAGKTTTLRSLLGLVRPNTGRVRVFGLDPIEHGPRVRGLVGVLLESDGLYDRLSAWNNLDYYSRIWHLPPLANNSKALELLQAFELWERRHERVVNWSKGMRQKLAVTRAMLHGPKLLLLDEPFSGLDPTAAVELRARIVALARQAGVTVILATHDLAHVEKACSRVVLIRAGRVIAEGSPDRLVPEGDQIEVAIDGEGLHEDVLAAMQRDGLLVSFSLAGRSARVTCSRKAGKTLSVELTRRGVVIEELRTIKRSLEETFLALTSGSAQPPAGAQ
jgi:ABC-2 type transport system ATP-binding protein